MTIDVVICTYNHADSLDHALGALCRQRVASDVEWRIVVVNNNCTDHTDTVVNNRARASPVPLTTVYEAEQGLTPARRRGVLATSGDWIAFVDDDCFVSEDWIEEAARFAQTHPGCGGFGGRVMLDWDVPPPDFVVRYSWAFAEQELGTEPRRVSCLAGAGLVLRRAALAECGWIHKQFLADRVGHELVSGGDVEISLRVASRWELWYNPACQLRHRISQSRSSAEYVKGVVYSLGASKLLGESLLWGDSYPRWVLTSFLQSRTYLRTALSYAARAARGGGGAIDAAIWWRFLLGWYAGMWRLWSMEARQRRQLMGCAKPPTGARLRS